MPDDEGQQALWAAAHAADADVGDGVRWMKDDEYDWLWESWQ
jgi:hypothetical protein